MIELIIVKQQYFNRKDKQMQKIIMMVIGVGLMLSSIAYGFTTDQIADAIYKAEGSNKTNHPYGILQKYKHTTPRQACINTIVHARKDFKGKYKSESEFISLLGDRYCPVGAKNDPKGLNKNWKKNVNYFLNKTK